MKILLVDDHALVREGLTHILNRLDDVTVILEAADCNGALKLAKQHPDIDVALLDITLPGMNGIEGIDRLRERLPSTPIVMLSVSEDPEIVQKALRRGAQGFIPKSSTGNVMLSALRLVLSGGVYLPPSLLHRPGLPGSRPPPTSKAPESIDDGLDLTHRQREVLALVIKGRTNKEIARELNMSEATVRTHATAIFKTLNVTNRTQAGHIAAQRGFCEVQD